MRKSEFVDIPHIKNIKRYLHTYSTVSTPSTNRFPFDVLNGIKNITTDGSVFMYAHGSKINKINQYCTGCHIYNSEH